MRGCRLRPPLAFEQRFGLRLDFLFPQANLHGMYPVLLSNIVGRFHTSQRLQTYLRLELRGVGFTLLRFAHFFSSFMTAHILNCCLENRVHYIMNDFENRYSNQIRRYYDSRTRHNILQTNPAGNSHDPPF